MSDVDDIGVSETAGERLHAAREAQGLSLDAVAAQTRIPIRHLEALEAGEWSTLPAPTYSIGFAKNYASVVGLDRDAIGDQLRSEMGGTRPISVTPEVFQPADPKRSMPLWLIVGAVVAGLLLLAVLNYRRGQDLEPAPSAAGSPPAEATPLPAQAPPAAPLAGPVSITALDAPVWIRVSDSGRTLKIGNLAPGERFDLPSTVTAPTLDAGRPEGLKITVGGREVPAIGRPGHAISKVSLTPTDLERGAADASSSVR